jgi:TonB-linked SusC/RagA family outer membrane protein
MNKRIPTVTSSKWKWSGPAVLLLAGCLAPAIGWAQQDPPRTVSGRITSDDGEVLAGVTVVLKGVEAGTTTDTDGRYTLVVPSDTSVLVVCATGYACRELPVRRARLSVTLLPETQARHMQQMVGYGTQVKSQVTGAIATVGEEQLRDVPAANIGQALQGRVPGVSVYSTSTLPGQNPVIRIRGNRSFLGASAPLLVVDGVPFDGNLNDLNPDDIAAVDVLRDAAATAVYGGRGANGVLLLTTRRGRIGAPHVSYSGYAGPKSAYGRYDLQNGKQYYAYRLEAFRASNPSYNPASSEFLTADERANYAAGKTTDYQRLLLQQGHLQNHTIGVRGGTNQTQYAASVGYYDETGIVPVQRFQRYSLHATLDQQLGRRVKLGLSTLNASLHDDDPNVNVLNQMLTTSPLASAYDAAGNPVLYPNGDQANPNPLTLYLPDMHRDQRRRQRRFNSVYAQVTILKGLDYRMNVGVDKWWETSDSFYAANTPQGGGGLSSAYRATQENSTQLLENVLTYSRTLGQHSLHATGLYSGQRYRTENTSVMVLGASGGGGGGANGLTSNFQQGTFSSLMGRLHYAYANRYSATLTVRNDGSSRLSPEKKIKLFPAAAVAWNLTNEPLVTGGTWLSGLKLRASAGRVGGSSATPLGTLGPLGSLVNPSLSWEHTTTLNTGLDFSFWHHRVVGSLDVYRQRSADMLLSDALPTNTGYSFILRNGAQVQNQGLELALTTVNVRADAPGNFAWSTEWNFARNREQILDLGLQNTGGSPQDDIGNRRFIGQPLFVFYDYQKVGIWQTAEADEARRYGSKPGQIKVRDVNADGRIDASDRQVIGSHQPKFEAGFTNRFRFRGFDMTLVALTRVGATVLDQILSGPGFYTTNNGRRNQLNLNYWTPTNPTNDFPQPDQSARSNEWAAYSSTLGYRNGTFVKVRSLDLGYTVPAAWVGRVRLTSARVYMQVQNPFIWARDPHFQANKAIDPDVLSYPMRSNAGAGVAAANTELTGGNYPVARAFLAGVHLSF